MKWHALALVASGTSVLGMLDNMPRIKSTYCKLKLQSLESPPYKELDGKYLSRAPIDGSHSSPSVALGLSGKGDESEAAKFRVAPVNANPPVVMLDASPEVTLDKVGASGDDGFFGKPSNVQLTVPLAPQFLAVVPADGLKRLSILKGKTNDVTLDKREEKDDNPDHEKHTKKGKEDDNNQSKDKEDTITTFVELDAKGEDKKGETLAPLDFSPFTDWKLPSEMTAADRERFKPNGKWIAVEKDGKWEIYWKTDELTTATDRPVSVMCETVQQTKDDAADRPSTKGKPGPTGEIPT